MPDQVFGREDTALYATWHRESGGIVSLVVPGIGEVKMTLAKAEEISADIARQVEYGRWHAMEIRHVESNINARNAVEASPIEEANKANRQVYPGT